MRLKSKLSRATTPKSKKTILIQNYNEETSVKEKK